MILLADDFEFKLEDSLDEVVASFKAEYSSKIRCLRCICDCSLDYNRYIFVFGAEREGECPITGRKAE